MSSWLPASATVRMWGGAACALALLLAGFYSYTVAGREEVAGRVWRVGWKAEPPLAQAATGGRQSGFVADSVRRAAARRGLRLQWVAVTGDPGAALRNRTIDIWPVAWQNEPPPGTTMPPWAELRLSLVSRAESQATGVEDLSRQRVAVAERALWEALDKQRRPTSVRIVETGGRRESLAALCRGTAEAAVIEQTILEQLLLERPPECHSARLRSVPVPRASRPLRLAGRAESAAALRELHAELGSMASDGTLRKVAQQGVGAGGVDPVEGAGSWWSTQAGFLAGCLVLLVAAVVYLALRRGREETEVQGARVVPAFTAGLAPADQAQTAAAQTGAAQTGAAQTAAAPVPVPAPARKRLAYACDLEATLRQSLELARLASATDDRQSAFSLEAALPERVDCLEDTLRHELSTGIARAFQVSQGQGISLRARFQEPRGVVAIEIAAPGAAGETEVRPIPRTPGQGSELPAVELRLQVPGKAGSTRPRVLLVEDNPLNRASAKRLMQDLGYDVEVAEDGAAALTLLQRQSYDLVLVDYQMPGLDGAETTRMLRKQETGMRTPVVLMLVGQDPYQRRSGAEAGADDFLDKPLRPYNLSLALRRWAAPGG